ncbi:DUF6143 family protein [Clostridium thailandense]|uniref:DUF6143 family protein n=1 Tax=Clostridium thailandense TaxID=2794346 RepID=UPI003989F44B
MSHENSNYIISNKSTNPQKVVSIPVSLFESIQGEYFVGQTETLMVGNKSIAWAGLVNPRNSNINLYVNVFTISNFSDDYLTAEIWLNTNLPEKWHVSHNVSATNTALNPLPKNKVNIRFVSSITTTPKCGINVYRRIVPPNSTLVAEEDGKFIEPPGGNYVLVIKSESPNRDKVIVAFGWWEKQKHC